MGAAAGPIFSFAAQAAVAGAITTQMVGALVTNLFLTGLTFEEDGEIWVARDQGESA